MQDYQRNAEWFTEITNTFLELQLEQGTPTRLVPRTAYPFPQIKKNKGREQRSQQCQEYLRLVDRYVEEMKSQGRSEREVLEDKDRPFLRMKNAAGRFKSAYG